MVKKIINFETEANKVDKIFIEHFVKIGLNSEQDFIYNPVFGNNKKPDFLIFDRGNKNKISFIIENKLKYDNFLKAKNQGLEYINYLRNNNKLLDRVILIITDGISFKIDLFEVSEEIVHIKEIKNIKILKDIDIGFLFNNNNFNSGEKISFNNQRSLNKSFDEINDTLRNHGLSSDQRLHLTMAFLFLKLIKEDSSSFEDSKYKKTLNDNLLNLDKTTSETNIISVFDTISKIFENKFSFTINEYMNKNILMDLWKIVNKLDLDHYDSDIKGEAFEYFINYGNIKSDIGEYFTPRHIIDFMINLLDKKIKNNLLYNRKGELTKYFDPTCGTGGFLIRIFKRLFSEIDNDKDLLKTIKTKCVYGNELSKRTSEITKMNMILAGDGHTNIKNENFLDIVDSEKGKYDVVIGNMPFGKKIKEPEIANGFLESVKENGYLIFIVPSGVIGSVNKKGYKIFREKLLTKGRILNIISLPMRVFSPYTPAKTYIIFWKKEEVEENYDIEFFDVKNDGYTLNDRRDKIEGPSDLDLFLEKKELLKKSGQVFSINSKQIIDIEEINKIHISLIKNKDAISKNKLRVSEINRKKETIQNKKQKNELTEIVKELNKENSVSKNKINENEKYLNSLNYSFKFSQFEEMTLDNKNLVSLSDVAEIIRGPFGSSIKNSLCVPKGNDTYKLYEQSSIIKKDLSIGQKYVTKEKFEELKRFRIESEDVLMTCAGTLGEIYRVPVDHEKGIMNSVLMRFRPNKEKIFPEYLELMLQTKKIKAMLLKDCIGIGLKNMIPTSEVKLLKIPLPSIPQQKEKVKEYRKLLNKIEKEKENMNDYIEKQKQKIDDFQIEQEDKIFKED